MTAAAVRRRRERQSGASRCRERVRRRGVRRPLSTPQRLRQLPRADYAVYSAYRNYGGAEHLRRSARAHLRLLPALLLPSVRVRLRARRAEVTSTSTSSYNSYIWHPYSVYRYDTYGSYGYPVGELRLKVQPRDAQVFIDGYYAGRVDDFDGVFQSLRLEEGEYQVEIVLPGYEPLAFDVRIYPGEKTTYEGDLLPELP